MGDHLLKWTLAIVMLLAAVGVELTLLHGDRRAVLPVSSVPLIQVPAAPDLKRGAEKALQDFFEAPSLEARAACARDTARILPLMRDYYQQRGKPFTGLDRILGASVVQRHAMPWVLFQIRDHTGQIQPLAVEWQAGTYRVDWESFTAYGSMDWIEFIERKPAASQLLRVHLGRVPEKFASDGKAGHFCAEHRDDPGEPVEIDVPPEFLEQVQQLTDQKITPVTIEAKWDGEQMKLMRLCYEGWSQ